MTTVYKVVRNNGSTLISAAVQQSSKPCLIYKPDMWTVPKVGYIMAFSGINYASHFRDAFLHKNNLEVWTAEADTVEAWTLRILSIPWSSRNHYAYVKKYWELVNNHISLDRVKLIYNNSGAAPVGTVFCKRLKLIERIE